MDKPGDIAALEREYNPRVSAPDFEDHLRLGAEAAARALATLRADRHVRYGPGPRQLLDIFPGARQEGPVNVFFQGGFWRALSKDSVAGAAPALVEAGITCVNVGYDLCPDVGLAEIVAEARAAVRWVHANIARYGGDPGRIYVSGISAGAHLAALTLSADWQGATGLPPRAIRGSVLVSGIYDVRPVLDISINEQVRLTPADVAAMSPVEHLPSAEVELLILVGADETRSWIEQSQRYAAACRSVGVSCTVESIQGAHHFSTGAWLPDGAANHRMREFIVAHAGSSAPRHGMQSAATIERT